MKYTIYKGNQVNALNERLDDLVLSEAPDHHVKFAAHFERHYYPLQFESLDEAIEKLNNYYSSERYQENFLFEVIEHEGFDLIKIYQRMESTNEIYRSSIYIVGKK